jgi:hypothetical protein
MSSPTPHWLASNPADEYVSTGSTASPHKPQEEQEDGSGNAGNGQQTTGESGQAGNASNPQTPDRISMLITQTLSAHNTYSGLTAKIAYQQYVKESFS